MRHSNAYGHVCILFVNSLFDSYLCVKLRFACKYPHILSRLYLYRSQVCLVIVLFHLAVSIVPMEYAQLFNALIIIYTRVNKADHFDK